MTLATLFGLQKPPVYTNGKATPLSAADPTLLYGVELEIENVPNWEDLVVSGMTSVEDGSLRNNGREFLTTPSTYSVLIHTLTWFFERAKLSDNNYSERCSVHVHGNCQDMELTQIASVCLLYQVFERLLYGFVGNDRDKNIFCIPWDQTTLTFNVINTIKEHKTFDVRRWQKYTGLNIIPLLSKGTLEFRQLNGTSDVQRIGNWLNLIGSLYAYAKRHEFNKIKADFTALNTTSAYRHMTENVFTEWSPLLMSIPGYQMLLEEGVLNMKYSLLGKAEKPYTPEVEFADPRQGAIPSEFTAEIQRLARERRDGQLARSATARNTSMPPTTADRQAVMEERLVMDQVRLRDAAARWARTSAFLNTGQTVGTSTGTTTARVMITDPSIPFPTQQREGQ